MSPLSPKPSASSATSGPGAECDLGATEGVLKSDWRSHARYRPVTPSRVRERTYSVGRPGEAELGPKIVFEGER